MSRRKAKTLNKNQMKPLLRLYNKGLKAYEIAEKTGHERNTIIWNLNQAGHRFNRDQECLKRDLGPARKSIVFPEESKYCKVDVLMLAKIELYEYFSERYGATFYKGNLRWTICEVMRDLNAKRVLQGKDQIVYCMTWKI